MPKQRQAAMDLSAKKLRRMRLAVSRLLAVRFLRDITKMRLQTREAFTEHGWFITGDRALKDSEGNLNLVGRVKESIIVNGVKYFPSKLNTALEEASVDGATPSYTVVFPHRPTGAETETLCVAYLPTYCSDDTGARVRTADAITKVCITPWGVRPFAILSLSERHLSKSSLGKISRIKIRAAFENGALQDVHAANDKVIREFRVAIRVRPSSDNEPVNRRDRVDVSLFDLGVTSVEIIRFKKRLEEKLQLKEKIPLILILTNSTLQAMAKALE
ncbi:MAG: hypothetical protein Q9204_003626 [Flavoplaca sp. TL-2023a]